MTVGVLLPGSSRDENRSVELHSDAHYESRDIVILWMAVAENALKACGGDRNSPRDLQSGRGTRSCHDRLSWTRRRPEPTMRVSVRKGSMRRTMFRGNQFCGLTAIDELLFDS